MPLKTQITPEFFYARIEKSKNGCWLWKRARYGNGYGAVTHGGKLHSAHRLSYETFVGPIPSGLFVCHKCDVRTCVNPDHLFVGTHRDNMRDCVSKGRSNGQRRPWTTGFFTGDFRGEKNGHAKLTKEDVVKIREMRKSGTHVKEIASMYGIYHRYVYSLMGSRWTHIDTKDAK